VKSYIAIDLQRQAWGRGATQRIARLALQAEGGRTCSTVLSVEGDAGAYVDEMGNVCASRGAHVEIVYKKGERQPEANS